ncbi:hypothetical protein WJX73_000011 [Symbiochloris irregularis]|uniref:Uncharacterized protein n=1 Tax=Symbiochloris irregularis TaxID=706552 RepID=A0AAW1PLR9_9CHLO
MTDPPDETGAVARADTPACFSRTNNTEQVLWHSNPSFKLWHDMPLSECSDVLVKKYISHIKAHSEDIDAEGCPARLQSPDGLAFQGYDDTDGSSDCATPVKDACIRPFTPEQTSTQGSPVGQDGSPCLPENLFAPLGNHGAPLPGQEGAGHLRQHLRASPLSRHLSLTSPPFKRAANLDPPDLMHQLLSGVPKGLSRLRTGTVRDNSGPFSPSLAVKRRSHLAPFSPHPATPLSQRAARRLKMLHKRTSSGPWFEINLEG